GIIEHINVGEGAHLAARSTVLRDVPAGARWAGLSNAKPIKQYFRELVMIERVARGADVADLRRERAGAPAGAPHRKRLRPPAISVELKPGEMMDDVATEVMAIIAKKLPVEGQKVALTDRLEDLGIDSFGAVEMIFDLEEKFDIQISYNSNDARPEFETVGDVVAAIQKIVNGKS